MPPKKNTSPPKVAETINKTAKLAEANSKPKKKERKKEKNAKSSRGKSKTRRAGVLSTVGLVVEGDAEFLAIPLLHKEGLIPKCPPLKPINLGGVGSDRDPVGIAKLIAPKIIQHVVAGRTSVVVCIDREQRNQSAAQFTASVWTALSSELTNRKQSAVAVKLVVADRAFEAWILADATGLHSRGHFIKPPNFVCFEGELGEQQKKGVVELDRLLGRSYSKTKDSVGLFRKLDFSAARNAGPGKRGSASLDAFLRAIGV